MEVTIILKVCCLRRVVTSQVWLLNIEMWLA